MFYESVDFRNVDIVGAVGPDLVFVDLGEDVGCVFSDAAFVPKLCAEAAEAVIVGWGDDNEQVVDVYGPGGLPRRKGFMAVERSMGWKST